MSETKGQQAKGSYSIAMDDDRNNMGYILATRLTTHHNEQQLLLYIHEIGYERFLENEIKNLELVQVQRGDFTWPHPKGDTVTAVVTTGSFSSTQEQVTSKLMKTKLLDKIVFRLPVSNATLYTVDVEILEHQRQLLKLTNVEIPGWPEVTKEGNENEEEEDM